MFIADTILSPQYIVTVCPKQVLQEHSIAIKAGKIVAIIANKEVHNWTTAKMITLPTHTIMPGMINAHAHSAMTLLRGKADDLDLMDWLENHIWPAEGAHMSDEFVHDGTLVAMSEMIRSGTTTVNDMYFFNDAVARAGKKSGMRTFVGCSILEFPTAYAKNAREHIDKSLEEIARFGHDDLITFTLAPHAPYTVSDETFIELFEIAKRENLRIHCHIHETEFEVGESLKLHGVRPLERLKRLGVLDKRWMAAHMVHINEEEIAIAKEYGLSALHNPASNMKLASGIAPVQKCLDQGINVALGTDGAASNNALNMFSEMRLAALLAKVGTHIPTDLDAHTVIEMATINGARALGIDDKVGSIEVGKEADLIAIDLNAIETMPLYDPISHIVYAAGREQVTHVWVKGKTLLEERKLTTLDLKECMEKARYWHNKIVV